MTSSSSTTVSATAGNALQAFERRANQAELQLIDLENAMKAVSNAIAQSSGVLAVDEKEDTHEGYEVHYWPTITNRGNFMRLLFIEAGIPYKNVTDVIPSIRAFGGLKYTDAGYFHAMAVPMIKRGDFMLCQTTTIANYLSHKFGLSPKCPQQNALAQSICASANDCLPDCRDAAMQPDASVMMAFVTGRLQVWMDIFQKPLTKEANQLYYFGERLCQADIFVYHMMTGIKEFLGKYYEQYAVKTHPVLAAFHQRMSERPKFEAFAAQQKAEGLMFWPREIGNNMQIVAKSQKMLDEATAAAAANDDDDTDANASPHVES